MIGFLDPASVIPVATEALGIVPIRAIGPIIADVTIREQSSDDLTITRHPVEVGAPVSDHAYKQPTTVTIEAGWGSNPALIYAVLRQFQALRLPFLLFTGKAAYNNMLIANISQVTDSRTANVLFATVRCEQVILVQTSAVTVPQNQNQQAFPQSTAGVQNNGVVSLQSGQNFNPRAGDAPGGA